MPIDELTQSSANYLLAIDDIQKKQGHARLTDISKQLKISKGSLSTSLKGLKKKDYIFVDEKRHYQLTQKGLQALHKLRGTFFIVNRFLNQILNVDKKTSEKDASKIEHLLSKKSCSKLLALFRVLKTEPKVLKHIQSKMKKIENVGKKTRKGGKCVIKGF